MREFAISCLIRSALKRDVVTFQDLHDRSFRIVESLHENHTLADGKYSELPPVRSVTHLLSIRVYSRYCISCLVWSFVWTWLTLIRSCILHDSNVLAVLSNYLSLQSDSKDFDLKESYDDSSLDIQSIKIMKIILYDSFPLDWYSANVASSIRCSMTEEYECQHKMIFRVIFCDARLRYEKSQLRLRDKEMNVTSHKWRIHDFVLQARKIDKLLAEK